MGALFKDCEFGAVPPLGLAYGMSTVIDDCLSEQPEIYFEAGDHDRITSYNVCYTKLLRLGHLALGNAVAHSGGAALLLVCLVTLAYSLQPRTDQ